MWPLQGKLGEALELYYEALAIKEKVLGKEHHSYALQLNNIASLLHDQVRSWGVSTLSENVGRVHTLQLKCLKIPTCF